jgi:hypothetical protein
MMVSNKNGIFPMTRIAVMAIIALAPFSLPTGQDSQPVSNSLAALHEIKMDISPQGIIANSCISIQRDGHFHLESRWQQLPTPSAILHIYEGTLDDFQLRRLKNLLDSQDIKALGPYPTPIPLRGYLSSQVSMPTFNVKIMSRILAIL